MEEIVIICLKKKEIKGILKKIANLVRSESFDF